MPQLEMIPNICPKCSAEFTAQRAHYCRELLRYQRENFAQRGEINALEAQLKHALQKLLNAERRYDNLKHQSQPQVVVDALFDFMGYLTSREKRIVLSAADDATPAVDAIRDFAIKRGLSLDASAQSLPSCTPA